MTDFRDVKVVVTGAAGGIGRNVASAYARAGAKVILTDLASTSGQQLADALEAEGLSVKFIAADLSEPSEVTRLFEETVAWAGSVDILINNAGFGIWKSPLELEVDEWDRVVNLNLRGTFLCAREAAKLMQQQRSGRIVNIASTRAAMSEPNSEAYAATKGGIVALTHALAVSLGSSGITVNCISPGWIENGNYAALREEDHSQHPSGRVGRPEDIVRACFYLTEPGNDFVTGINLTVDGGMTRKMIYVEDEGH